MKTTGKGGLLPSIVHTLLVVLVCWIEPCRTKGGNDFGGAVRGVRTLYSDDSPVYVRTDIVIEAASKLIVMPEVELRFAPGVGITVTRGGTLYAKGEPGRQINFTRIPPDAHWSDSDEGGAWWPGVRLVDGDSILEGRLQMFYKSQWRSVCTNSKNWTESDLQVMCRQLGFNGGLMYRWFPRSNDSSQLLYEDPYCNGSEISLSGCPNWERRQLGSGVCDYHEDIGIRCDRNVGYHHRDYWRGLKFLYAEAKPGKPIVNKVMRQVSSSILEHVSIHFAGRDSQGNATPAVYVTGVSPQMKFMDIRWSAYDGIHYDKPTETFMLEHSEIAENRGYGVFINSSVGLTTLSGVSVRDNGGDGVHFVHHEDFVSDVSLCETGNIGDQQVYPVRRSLLQQKGRNMLTCEQVFQVASSTGQVLTVHFLGLKSDTDIEQFTGHIEVYDGPTDNSRRLANVPVLNNTKPQSVTSSRQRILLRYHPAKQQYASFVSFTLEIVANPGRAYDLNLTNCNVTGNNGKGVVVNDQRSGVLINGSILAENSHLAGLDISGGSGDLVINNTHITANVGDGVNVTSAGGFIHIDHTSIANNTGRGLAFWFNESSTSVVFNHTAHISHSEIVQNGLYGVLIGNQCKSDAFWNISLNAFRKNQGSAITFLSCWLNKKSVKQANVLITHNQFLDSDHLGIELFPALNIHALIEHNEFQAHRRGAMLIRGVEEDGLYGILVKLEIQFNHFIGNSGTFVANIGVLQGSFSQELIFTQNRLEQNDVQEPFHSLNPRSRVAAVVVVSSENSIIYRNFFFNQNSKYELGSHLERHDLVINATYNYWGTTVSHEVYRKLFDRKDRYNLAPIEFLPYLTFGSDLTNTIAISIVREGDNIFPFKNNQEIGGEVAGMEILDESFYNVRRDIYVKPGATLQILPGTVLKFDKSVGMMVQGTLLSGDVNQKTVTYTIAESLTSKTSHNVRLSNNTEGRLEVLVENKWGTVCMYGWDIIDASVVCHQMGLVLHPDDWVLEQSQFSHSSTPNFVLSNVQCSLLDTDITHCKSEKDFENSCFAEVGLRCYEPSWSGLRLGMAAEESRLQNVVIEHAGLLDYSTNSFKPALQIDFNRHHIDGLDVHKNKDSGIGVMWNEMFSSENHKILNSEMHSNRKHGLVISTQGINVFHCAIKDNAGSGIHYNPMFSKKEQRDLTTWINLKDRNKVVVIPDDVEDGVIINPGSRRYFTFSKSKTPIAFKISTNPGRKLGIMVLNPFRKSSTEEMSIFKRMDVNHDVEGRWDMRKNLTSFPLRTPGYGVLISYNPGENPSGEGILYMVSVEGQRGRSQSEVFPTIHVNNVSIHNCGRGFSSHHFNRDQSDQGDHFHRYSNETILITNSEIAGSKAESVFVWTPYLDTSISDLAEVNYTIINSTIRRNSQGLLHYSRDIRNSNNIFHWTINNTIIEENKDGGVDIRLPYVWQYTENYTHSFIMHSTRLTNNSHFLFSIHGHFARVNMSDNIFQYNFCKRGVISFTGMEKEMLIEDNFIRDNLVHFAVEFNLESHADKFGVVRADFRKNIVRNNRDISSAMKAGYQPTSYAIAIRGVQPINITRNLFENRNLQYELLAGVLTGSLDNSINVGENWWGTRNVTHIRERIFDFDDWNGYVLANFSYFLGIADINGGVYPAFEEKSVHLDRPLGGRIFSDVTLSWKNTPYTVSSDLTVMPNAVLTIQPGVILEFYPSVGILVLGDLVAQGSANYPIIMRPIRMKHEYRFRRQATHPKSRLCVNEKCEGYRSDGFLEIFNATTEQWVPVCDARFTERNAQVVCHELGYNTLNVHVKNGPRLDLGPTQIGRVRSWPHPLECLGGESALLDCEFRLNGYIENYQCSHMQDFVYVYCGPDALDTEIEDHWGGIRFSIPSFESHAPHFSRPTLSYSSASTSKLEYIQIIGAGILHGEKSGAIQMVHRDVGLDFVNVTKSAGNGIEAIAVPRSLSFNELIIKDNLGVGISFLSLTGESRNSVDLISDPLMGVDLPYSVFGMVDICDTNKEMLVENRVLVYYKYDNKPVDCVKIFSSLHNSKQIGFRVLQFNLFNGTDYSAQPDVIRIFDGDIFNQSTPDPKEIGWQFGLKSATKSYVSSLSTLSVQLHTIGGGGDKGFIAEVVTLPISYPIDRGMQHNVSYCEITGNSQEGIAYRSAGEITPAITVRHNRIDHNGRELFGNFTVSDSAVFLDIRNTLDLFFFNNLLMANQGGLHIRVDSLTSSTALRGLIVNNLFTENQNREALLALGGKQGALQFIDVYRNYFTRNSAQYWDTIAVSQVVSNFTENMAYNNTGKHLLDVQGFQKIPLSYQTCQRNWFWKNTAKDVWDRSTIVSSNAGQRFNYNYLVNPDNDFELAAMNRSMLEVKESLIDASKNWWGFNRTAAIAGRIKDYHDQEELLEVKYYPFLPDNSSVLDGKCAGGWTKIGDTCFLYVGGIMNFSEAKKFCEMDNASMPYVKTNHDELMAFVQKQQFFYHRYSDRVWIRSIDIPLRQCGVLVNRRVITWPCGDYFPFLCERDPEITVSTRSWLSEPLTIVFLCVASLAVLVVFLCLGFWFCKSRQRYREKLERRNSIRTSIRSNRSLTGFSELGYKRRIERVLEVESAPKISEMRLNGSVDSIEKAPSRFSCSMDDSYDHTPADTSARVTHNSDYSDFVDRFHRDPQLENANINMMVHPTFDLTYENHGYIDRSVSRNSHEISRDWSTTTGSTLDMKRSLDHDSKDEPYQNGAYRNSPSPQVPSSRESNSRDGASSCSSSRQAPLETAM